MENRRFILFALLGVVLFFMYQAWQKDYVQTEQPPAPRPTATANATDDLPAATNANTAAAAVPPASAAASAVQAKTIQVETDVLRVEISTQGGEIRRVELKGYPESKDHPETPLALLDDSDSRWFILQSGLAGVQAPLTSPQTVFAVAQNSYRLAEGADTVDVPLEYADAAGYSVRKLFRFSRNSYQIGVTQTLKNSGTGDISASPYMRYQRNNYTLSGEPKFSKTFKGIGVYEQKEPGTYRFHKTSFDDLSKESVELKQTGGWLTVLQHYFVAAIIPPASEAVTLTGKPGKERGYTVQYVGASVAVAPGTEHNYNAQLYIGPKLQGSIGDVAPGLELTLDYGILTFFAKLMFIVLQFFHKYTGNWGASIILLTLSVKLGLFKLSEAQYRSMARMKKFAPKIQDIKERYGEDRERMQKAMMDLYKKEGFNPLAGCWPLLIQMPIFLALYWVLLESVELRQAPFALWLKDLSAADPYFVLPVLFGASMWFQQRLSGQSATMDPMQQKVMNVMPIMLTAFFAFFQSGLVLYWLVSNLIGIAQQWVITRRLENENTKQTAKA